MLPFERNRFLVRPAVNEARELVPVSIVRAEERDAYGHKWPAPPMLNPPRQQRVLVAVLAAVHLHPNSTLHFWQTLAIRVDPHTSKCRCIGSGTLAGPELVASGRVRRDQSAASRSAPKTHRHCALVTSPMKMPVSPTVSGRIVSAP